MTHDAHIQTALSAACAFGRRQYDARVKYRDYDCTNALRAIDEMYKSPPPAPHPTPQPAPSEVQVIGGGNSLTGKIKWLLENKGALTRVEMAEQIGVEVHSVAGICNALLRNGVVQFAGRGAGAKFSLVGKAVGA
jgi:hypothetical protein